MLRHRQIYIIALLLAIFTWLFSMQVTYAAVDWTTCQVDSGVTQIANGTVQTQVASALFSPDPGKMFIMSDASGSAAIVAGADHMVRSSIQGNQYVFRRDSSSGDVMVSYQAVYCPNDEFAVYRGSATLTTGNLVTTTGIAGAPSGVNPARAFVITSSSTTDSTASEASGLVRGRIEASGNQVTFNRGASAAETTIDYQVVEFSDESGVVVQHNTATLNPTDTESIQSTDEQSAPYVFNPSRTWMYCSWDTDVAGVSQSAIGCDVIDGTQVAVRRFAPNTAVNTVRYSIIQFPESAAFVQRGSATIDPTSTDNDEYHYDIGLTETGPLERSFSYTTNTTNGTDTAFPRQSWLERLISVVLLRLQFWRGDPAGNADETNFYWQTVHFGPYYEAQDWGWIGNSPDPVSAATPGYISFNCDNLQGYYGSVCADGSSGSRFDYFVALEYGGCGTQCDVTGQAWVGNYDSNDSSVYPIGMIDFDPVIDVGTYPQSPPAVVGDDPATPNENEQLDARWNPETGELYGWARLRSFRNAENTYAAAVGQPKQDDWGWIQLRGIIDNGSGNEFGVTFDPADNTFTGWSWSDDGSAPGSGTRLAGSGSGWIKFDLDITTGFDYVATKQGDVYASGDLNVPTPIGEYNATYLIHSSGTITAFTSELNSNPPGAPEEYTPETGVDVIPLPDDNGNLVYRGDLGTLHINELIATAQDQLNAQTGPCVSSTFLVNANPLANQVFYCDGDLTIDNNMVLYNAPGNQLGAGTIVVNGDLIVKDNLTYFNNAIASHVNNLASVAWIVLGDVIIEPTVTNLVGAFIVLNDPAGNGGEFDTGGGHLPLTVSGLVAASHFNLTRTNVGTPGSPVNPEPAEQIIYDGRVIANIPPGLEDFSKILPRKGDGGP